MAHQSAEASDSVFTLPRSMCGRFTSSQRREAIGERFEVVVPETLAPRFNVAPAQRILGVRLNDSGERTANFYRWGLLPSWAKDERLAFKMLNAKAETLTEKPAYRSLIAKKRVLIPADGFYEWRVSPVDGKKEPIRFTLAHGDMFALAGLWTSRVNEDTGEILESTTIITTTPNELVAEVHNRMPVIVPREFEQAWLDPDMPKEHALEMLRPYPAELMKAALASRRVNSVRNDDASLLEPDADAELAA